MANIKQIVFDNIAREKLLSGIEKTIQTLWCFDSYNALNLQQIKLIDPFENMGASFVKGLASSLQKECKTDLFASLTLFKELIKEGIQQINLGAHPSCLKNGMEKGVQALVHQIDESAISIQNTEKILSILDFSKASDLEGLFRDIDKKKALFFPTIFEKKSLTHLTLLKGLHLPHGYTAYIHEPLYSKTIKMENLSILIVDKSISSIYELLPIFKSIPSSEILIFAQDIEKDVLSTLVINNLYQHLKISVVTIPNLRIHLKEIVSFSNADEIKTNYFLGTLQKSWIEKEQTILINDSNKGETISQIDLQATTEKEYNLKKEQTQNYLSFVKHSIQSKLVLGSGHSLVFASQSLDRLALKEEEKGALTILKQGCTAFFRQMVLNAGKDPVSILSKVYQKKSPYGFHPTSQKIENLEKANLLEPAYFVKMSLIQASQTAEMILQSQALIADEQ